MIISGVIFHKQTNLVRYYGKIILLMNKAVTCYIIF